MQLLARLLCASLLLAALAGADVLRLGSGRAIRGKVVKETVDTLFVDVGYTILSVPKKEILSREADPVTAPDKGAVAEALTPPPGMTSYHAAFDRGSPIPGQNLWNLRPPDGSINAFDIGAAVVQFGHTCA